MPLGLGPPYDDDDFLDPFSGSYIGSPFVWAAPGTLIWDASVRSPYVPGGGYVGIGGDPLPILPNEYGDWEYSVKEPAPAPGPGEPVQLLCPPGTVEFEGGCIPEEPVTAGPVAVTTAAPAAGAGGGDNTIYWVAAAALLLLLMKRR